MARKRKVQPQTHLGWQANAVGGANDQDHLLLSGPWQGQAAAIEPLLEFLTAPAVEANDNADLDFSQVQDTPVDSPPYLWSGEERFSDGEDQPVVFATGEPSEPEGATVFS